jgi:flavin-dependent dehydrogenase
MTGLTGEEVYLLIVGNGPMGSACARLVAEGAPNARILMVESGPQLTERPGGSR